MKIQGCVFEKISIIDGASSHVVVFDAYSYYNFNKWKLGKLSCRVRGYSENILHNALWVSSKELGNTRCRDIFSVEDSFYEIPFVISKIKAFKNKFVASTAGVRKCSLVSFKLGEKNVLNKEFQKGLKFTLDENYIYTRSSGGRLIECYTYELVKQWEYSKLDGLAYIDFELAPQIHNDTLIINHAYDTIALNKKTGEEIWKYTFEAIPTSNVLMEGFIYAVCQAQLFVINPGNGEVLIQTDTGYPSRIEDADKINRIGVFPVGEYLYGIADYNGKEGRLKLFNKDASELLDVTEFPDYYINPYGSILPTIHDGKIYQSVRNANSYSDSGLLILDITDNEKAGIKVADRPPVTVIANPSLKDCHKLQIYLDVNTLDDALRYGELITKEVHYAVGYIPVWDARLNALDSKHNGEMELIIDNSGFEDGCDEYLERMSDNLKEFLESDTCLAGDKRTPIKFSLVKQEKPQWDISGEKLDWPEIRDYKEPLI